MKVAIVCAGGSFPLALVKSLEAKNKPFFLLLIKDKADKALENFSHTKVHISNIAKIIHIAKQEGCDKICFVGSLTRPNPFELLKDIRTLLLLPKIIKAFKGGDNHLLRSVASFFEQHGLTVIGAHEIAPQLLAPKGAWGNIQPNKTDLKDCQTGLQAAKTFGVYDVGQALIISQSHIVAVEGIEGTDGLLERVAHYRENKRLSWSGKKGILLKAIKPNQDERLDMPAIGVVTIRNSAKAGLKGVAVEAQKTLVMDIEAVTREADKLGIFVMGV